MSIFCKSAGKKYENYGTGKKGKEGKGEKRKCLKIALFAQAQARPAPLAASK